MKRDPKAKEHPPHREMALYNIVQVVLKKGSQQACQCAFSIAEKIDEGSHREYAFSEIAKHEAQQGNIEGALAAALKIPEHLTIRSDTVEYIADVLVEKGDVKQAMSLMEKYSGNFHYYPGKVALKLAKQGNFEAAVIMAKSIQSSRYPKHRDIAFAAIAVIMARRGMAETAINIAEQYIKHKDLQETTKASINEIVVHSDIENELKQVISRAQTMSTFGFLSDPPLDLLFKSLRKFGLYSAFLSI